MKQAEIDAHCITAAAAQAIENRREEAGISKLEMLRRVGQWDDGFTPSQYWRIQAGKAHWTLDRFVFVAAALGLDPAMLLDRILRGHDIMSQLRARDGPDDAGARDGSGGASEEGPTDGSEGVDG